MTTGTMGAVVLQMTTWKPALSSVHIMLICVDVTVAQNGSAHNATWLTAVNHLTADGLSDLSVCHSSSCSFCPSCHSGAFSDIKDSLMQALASYVCYPQSLRAVERIPEEQ
ncbi:hypothetical protein XENOCAPTIV_001657 [Xenoophorus captivus]|uniref:Uncharacterized protein n=1 Tax=Xenoophorus captivus TaxID=1517983 RepID=A0ABV0QXW8_9TELE